MSFRLRKVLGELDLDSSSRTVKRYFKTQNLFSFKTSKDQIVYVEWPQMASNNLALGFVLSEFCRLKEATPVAIRMARGRHLSRLKQNIKFQFSVHKTMGINQFKYLNYSERKSIPEPGWVEMFAGITSKDDLLDMHYLGVHVGDLIYDTYLTRYQSPTVDLTDNLFRELFYELLYYVDDFDKEFRQKRVLGVFVSHSVYHYAIPARVALKHGIDAYVVQMEELSKLSSVQPHPFKPSVEYKNAIARLSPEVLEDGIAQAKLMIERRFEGLYTPELELSTGGAFSKREQTFDSSPSSDERIKVLVATHDFFDAPHYFGKSFYPDFYEWLVGLRSLAARSNYQWFIKIHPDARGRMEELVKEIFKGLEYVQVLPLSISHHTILKAGIDVALTVHGTIGMEYPLLGIPVINASRVNPHSAFDFSFTPSDLVEYEKIILNLADELPIIGEDSPYAYFYVKFIHEKRNWMYRNHESYLQEVGGYKGGNSKEPYRRFPSSTARFHEESLKQIAREFLEG